MIWDTVVVGGGPAGSAIACLLARQGWAVELIDRARFPRSKPCGEFLSPAATPLLEDLGVRGRVEDAGAVQLDRVRILLAGEAPVELEIPDGCGAPPWGYSISRVALDSILLDAARDAGARVVEGIRIEDVLRDQQARVTGVAGRTAEGEAWSERARLVIGAGGRACPVARALGLQRRSRTARYDLLAHWRPRVSPAPACELHVGREAYVAAAPVENGRVNVNCVVSRTALRRIRDADALYRATLAEVPSLAAWTAGVREEPVAASDVTPLETSRATADGALLVGDAALFLDPFTGQGIFLALRSAMLAAPVADRALAEARIGRSSLVPYDHARHAEFGDKRRVSRALQAILYRPRLLRVVARALHRDRGLAATLAAVTGDLLPARRAWSFGFGTGLLRAGL